VAKLSVSQHRSRLITVAQGTRQYPGAATVSNSDRNGRYIVAQPSISRSKLSAVVARVLIGECGRDGRLGIQLLFRRKLLEFSDATGGSVGRGSTLFHENMFIYPKTYDVIVIGAGMPVIEAAMAASRLGCRR